MNFLRAARDEVKVLLKDAGVVYEYIPERITPPCFIIAPGSPYVGEGTTFTDFRVRFEVIALSGKATNDQETDAIDSLISDAIDALETWFIDGVETPSQFELNNAAYLGTRINISADKELIN